MERLGLDPYCWGSTLWHSMHSIAAGYPLVVENNDPIRNEYAIFYESLQNILPCEACREHYKQNLLELPINDYLGSRLELSEWVYKIHNKVNEITNKPFNSIPKFEEVYKKYTSYGTPCNSEQKVCGINSMERKCNIVIKNLNGFEHSQTNFLFLGIFIFMFITIIILGCLLGTKTKKK